MDDAFSKSDMEIHDLVMRYHVNTNLPAYLFVIIQSNSV